MKKSTRTPANITPRTKSPGKQVVVTATTQPSEKKTKEVATVRLGLEVYLTETGITAIKKLKEGQLNYITFRGKALNGVNATVDQEVKVVQDFKVLGYEVGTGMHHIDAFRFVVLEMDCIILLKLGQVVYAFKWTPMNCPNYTRMVFPQIIQLLPPGDGTVMQLFSDRKRFVARVNELMKMFKLSSTYSPQFRPKKSKTEGNDKEESASANGTGKAQNGANKSFN